MIVLRKLQYFTVRVIETAMMKGTNGTISKSLMNIKLDGLPAIKIVKAK
jgi:hypothetical protein